ncbi:MAG: glycosyltransferase, partial [bacterium]|nr:glycosyltransferase [bacterium]
MHLSVIIPAYNEERRLPGTLKEIDKYLRNQNYQSEIIVVDGGSKDRTPEVVKEMGREIGNLKLLLVQNCSGKGQAVKEGMASAGGDFRVFTDADNSTSIDQVEKMWPWFEEKYDVVIGSRD